MWSRRAARARVVSATVQYVYATVFYATVEPGACWRRPYCNSLPDSSVAEKKVYEPPDFFEAFLPALRFGWTFFTTFLPPFLPPGGGRAAPNAMVGEAAIGPTERTTADEAGATKPDAVEKAAMRAITR